MRILPPKKKVAVVVPVYKAEISTDEEISLRHLRYYLGHYDIYYVYPKGLELKDGQFFMASFDPAYFKNLYTYSKLLISREFYQAFDNYEFILIYQLDCLVFSDQLLKWCGLNYDYVGAPWLAGHNDSAYSSKDAVGNGGFSLRKISSALQVLESKQKVTAACIRLVKALFGFQGHKTIKDWLKAIRAAWRLGPFSSYVTYEDYFWSFEAKKLKPDFNIALPGQALAFSFESQPLYCFEKNGRQLPFGCHAWTKYDRQFWQPYLLKDENG